MFCRFCGRKIAQDSVFCPYCGKNLALPTEPDIIAPTVPEAVSPAPDAAPVPMRETDTAKPHSERTRWLVLAGLILLLAAVITILFVTKILCIHQWQEPTCTQPSICSRCEDTQGEKLGHKVMPPTCTDPVTCRICKETFGSALGHNMREATCTRGKFCNICKREFTTPLGHTWIEETFDTPKTCQNCGEIRPMTQPASGTVYIKATKYCGSKLTVHAAADYNTYLKLKDEEGNDIISFYLRAGETAKVPVPSGNYYLYLAHGIDWYGPAHAFGSDTVYIKGDDLLDFYTYIWEYTIDAGEDGNAPTTVIKKSDF